MNLTLVRHAYLPDVTLGRWFLPGGRIYCGLGEPWIPSRHGLGGQRNDIDGRESCIPDALYTMRPHISVRYPKDRYVWCLINEAVGVYAPGKRPSGQRWGRDAVLIHAGTTTDDIIGCELIGKRHGVYDASRPNMPAVFETQIALGELREILKFDEHTLEIRPTRGTSEASWS